MRLVSSISSDPEDTMAYILDNPGQRIPVRGLPKTNKIVSYNVRPMQYLDDECIVYNNELIEKGIRMLEMWGMPVSRDWREVRVRGLVIRSGYLESNFITLRTGERIVGYNYTLKHALNFVAALEPRDVTLYKSIYP